MDVGNNANPGANTPVTSPQLYSACKIADLESALLLLTRMYPSSTMAGAGFSLGGSILSKYLGETGKTTPLVGAVVVGAPFKLVRTSEALESTYVSKMYSLAMGRNLLQVLRRHVDALALTPTLWKPLELAFGERIAPDTDTPLPRPTADGPQRGTLRFADHYLVCQVGGYSAPYDAFPFASADAYYEHASSTNYMHNVARPLLAINADDDPIVPITALDELRAEVQANPNVILAHSKSGGHLGWFAGKTATRWVHTPANEYLAAVCRHFTETGAAHPDTGLGSGGPALSRWKQDGVEEVPVQVELLPVHALPTVLRGVTHKTHAANDAPPDAPDAPVHAWLRTHVLPGVPLVHPKDSPKHARDTPLAPGEMRTLTLVRGLSLPVPRPYTPRGRLYRAARRRACRYVSLLTTGGNGSIVQGARPESGQQPLSQAKLAGL